MFFSQHHVQKASKTAYRTVIASHGPLGGVRRLAWALRSWPRKHILPTVTERRPWRRRHGGPSGAVFCGGSGLCGFTERLLIRGVAGPVSLLVWVPPGIRPSGLTRRTPVRRPELTGVCPAHLQHPDRALARTRGASGCRGRLFPSAGLAGHPQHVTCRGRVGWPWLLRSHCKECVLIAKSSGYNWGAGGAVKAEDPPHPLRVLFCLKLALVQLCFLWTLRQLKEKFVCICIFS